ncbi:MAG TPA: hypothetical protein VFH80_32605 [Solirubrobacteraceae bacterium]|nr:hypothetical protein [Solirubrobacteraceae bacterium]
MNRAADKRCHLSRHERQRQARAEAFSRRSATVPIAPSPVRLTSDNFELIDRLVRRDRTAVSTGLLVIAGIGTGAARRRAVLSRIADATCRAQADGAISSRRAEQIARRVRQALARGRDPSTA